MKVKLSHIGLLFYFLIGLYLPGKTQSSPPQTMDEWYESGRSEFKKGNIQLAISHYTESGELALLNSDYENYVKTLTAIGKCYTSIGDQELLEQTLNQAKKVIAEHPGTVSDCLQGRLANLFAILYNYENRDSLILASYYEAETFLLNCDGGFATDLAGVWINMGFFYYKKGFYDQSEPFYQKGLNALVEMGRPNHPFVATAYHNLSRQYRIMLETEIALDYLHKSIDIRKKSYSKNHPYFAASYQTLGYIYKQLQQYEKAEYYFKEALNIYERQNLRDRSIVLNAKSAYANCIAYLGKEEEAEAIFLEVIEKLEQNYPNLKDPLAVTYSYLSKLYYRQNRLDEALFRAEKACEIQKISPQINQESLKIKESFLNKIYFSVKDTGKAEVIFDQTIKDLWPEDGDFSTVPAKQYLFSALYSKALILFRRKEYKAAEKMVEKGLEILQHIILHVKTVEDKSFFLETTTDILKLGMQVEYELFKETNNPAYFQQAFRIAELHKSHLLTEFLNNQKAISYAEIPEELIKKEEEIRTYLAYYKSKAQQYEQANKQEKSADFHIKAAELQHTHDSLILQIESQYPRYAQIKLNKVLISVEKVRKKLIKPGTALIEYFWEGNTCYVLTIEKNQLHFLKINNPNLLREDIEEYLALISDRFIIENQAYSQETVAQIDQASANIYHKLLAQSISPSINNLIIIPDGPLGYLPFDNLTHPLSPSANSYRDLNYLWKKATISYGFSANLLAGDLSQNRNISQGLAGFAPGNNLQDSTSQREMIDHYLSNISPLKYNQIEVESIAKIWGGDVFKGELITESVFRENAPGKRILHLAMHALINDSLPAFSGLLFQNNDLASQERSLTTKGEATFPTENDGLLTANEIYGLDLNADLVVLSACNTGLGQHKKGEGIMSLARAFAYAGCPNIVMTLWQADDQSTSLLMKYFYTYLEEGYSKSEALQKARFTFLANHDQIHPYYWGSFVISGDPSPIKSSNYWGMILGLGIFLIVLLIGYKYYSLRTNS